jgi:hypothetical protein
MSTKVYEAYRIKEGQDIEVVLDKIRRTARARMVRMIGEVVIRTMYSKRFMGWYYAKKYHSGRITPFDVLDYLSHLRRENSKEEGKVWEESYGFFNCSVSVFMHKGHVYLIPYTSKDFVDRKPFSVLAFMVELDELEDFSYWDNVDMPEGMTIEEWDARGEIWNEILADMRDRLDMIIWETGQSYMYDVDVMRDEGVRQRFYAKERAFFKHRHHKKDLFRSGARNRRKK